ncbi:hypothetical protein [Labilithrix luteola]|uniref:hypothetical protein n=1 Tax=Labilithrix luteola TaxID=1391654 RepID=UPI0011BA52B3|nr:hypothetical protein [Labilithrix luteola]
MNLDSRLLASVLRLSLVAAYTTSACALVGACSLTVPDDLVGNADPQSTPAGASTSDGGGTNGGEAGTGPGPSTEGGADAFVATGANLEPNGDFEEGSCAPWSGKATLSDAPGHAGLHACKVCSDTFAAIAIDDQKSAGAPVVGATYHLELWAKQATYNPAYNALPLSTTLATTDGPKTVESKSDTSSSLTANSWSKITLSLDVTKPAESLSVQLAASPPFGFCFLFDDVSVTRTK